MDLDAYPTLVGHCSKAEQIKGMQISTAAMSNLTHLKQKNPFVSVSELSAPLEFGSNFNEEAFLSFGSPSLLSLLLLCECTASREIHLESSSLAGD